MRLSVKLIFVSILSLFLLQACSVGMPLSGKEDPDLSVMAKGKKRNEAELHLGKPKGTKEMENDKIDKNRKIFLTIKIDGAAEDLNLDIYPDRDTMEKALQ